MTATFVTLTELRYDNDTRGDLTLFIFEGGSIVAASGSPRRLAIRVSRFSGSPLARSGANEVFLAERRPLMAGYVAGLVDSQSGEYAARAASFERGRELVKQSLDVQLSEFSNAPDQGKAAQYVAIRTSRDITRGEYPFADLPGPTAIPSDPIDAFESGMRRGTWEWSHAQSGCAGA